MQIVLFLWNFVSDFDSAHYMERLTNTPTNARYLAAAVLIHFARFLYITLLFSGGRRRRLNASITACAVVALAVTYALEYWPLVNDASYRPGRYNLIVGMDDLPWYLQRRLPQGVSQADGIMAHVLTRIIYYFMFTTPRF